MSVTVFVTQARFSLPGGKPWVALPRFLVRIFQFRFDMTSSNSTLRFELCFPHQINASGGPARKELKTKNLRRWMRRITISESAETTHLAEVAACSASTTCLF